MAAEILIDCNTDSMQDIYMKLMRKAYGGEPPIDSYDFPSGAILTPCDASESDYHIDIGHYEYDNEISNEPFYCPPVMNQASIPKQDRSTFKHCDTLLGDNTAFEKALKNVVELIVILEEYNKKTDNLIRWFKNEWGLRDDHDIKALLPKLRGTGPTKFATLDKNLNPNILYNQENTAIMRVVSHGITKRNLGDNKALDWARVQVILNTIGNLMICEGVKDSRFDYKLIPENIPDLHDDFEWDDDTIEIPDTNYYSEYNNSVLDLYVKRLVLYNLDEYEDEHITVSEADMTIIKETAIPDVQSRVTKGLDVEAFDLFTIIEQDSNRMMEDIVEPKREDTKKTIHVNEGELHGVRVHKHDVANIVKRLGTVENIPEMDYFDVKAQIRGGNIKDVIVDNIFTKPVLKAIRTHEHINNKEPDKFYGNLVSMYKVLKIPEDGWKITSIDMLHDRYIKNVKVRKACAKIYMNMLGEVFKWRRKNNVIDQEVLKIIRDTGDVLRGLSKFIGIRKKYWCKYYARKAKKKNDKRLKIINQQVSVLFNHVNVSTHGDIKFNRRVMNDAIYKIAIRYVEKRLPKDVIKIKPEDKIVKPENVPAPINEDVDTYARKIDLIMRWDIKMVDILKTVRKKAYHLAKDAKTFFVAVTNIDVDIQDEGDESGEDERIVETVQFMDHNAFTGDFGGDILNPVATEDPFAAFDGFGDDIAIFDANQDNLVNVADVLNDETLHYRAFVVAELDKKYNYKVPIKDKDKIIFEAHQIDMQFAEQFRGSHVDRVGDDLDEEF